MIYIPILGFIVAAIRIFRAQHAYFACHHDCQALADATWEPFHQFNISMAVTTVFFVLALLVAWRARLAAKAERKSER